MPLTFVVSTGRCGSTMLSRVLSQHPEVLSVSEFVATLQGATGQALIPEDEIDGARLWRLLSAPAPFIDMLIQSGLGSPEMCYPFHAGRFQAATGVPLICHFMLPMLTDAPDALYDKLAAEVPGWPPRAAGAQYGALFGYLAGLLGRPVIVERSGGSLLAMSQLRRLFPDARFVHMYRDGPDCALSMSRFPAMRIAYLAEQAARSASASDYDRLIYPPLDADRLMAYPVPADYFGRMWSSLVCAGVQELRELPAGSWISLSYEDLVLGDPVAELIHLAGFLGVRPDPAWLAAARRLIVGGRTGTAAAALDRQAMAALRQACEPGAKALAGLRLCHVAVEDAGEGGTVLVEPVPAEVGE